MSTRVAHGHHGHLGERADMVTRAVSAVDRAIREHIGAPTRPPGWRAFQSGGIDAKLAQRWFCTVDKTRDLFRELLGGCIVPALWMKR